MPLKTLAIGFAIGLISCTTGLAVGRVVPEGRRCCPEVSSRPCSRPADFWRPHYPAGRRTVRLQSGIAERQVLVLDHATLLSDQPGGSETATINMTLHAGELLDPC